MDPKLSNLDPKLQDAYNRVMTGAGNNQSPQPQPGGSNQTPPPPQPIQPQQSSPDIPPSVPPPPLDPAPGITPPSQFGVNQSPPVDLNPNPNPEPANTAMPPVAAPDISTQPPQEAIPSQPMMPEAANQPEPIQTPPPAPPENNPNPVIETTVTPTSPSPAMPSSSSTVAFNASNSSKNVGTTPVKKGGLRMLPLLIGLGVVVLLVVYTFVWVVIFNVEVPFIPAL